MLCRPPRAQTPEVADLEPRSQAGLRNNGVVLTHFGSKRYAETLNQLLEAIASRGLSVFAKFDHAAAAREVDMDLAPEIVVVFGNPRSGTPMMEVDPRIGIELPLRIVLWESNESTVIGYNDPRELADVYDVGEYAQTLDAMAALLADLAQEAAA